MILPLACIWYGAELGSYASEWQINEPPPGIMAKIVGWVLLSVALLAAHTFMVRVEMRW